MHQAGFDRDLLGTDARHNTLRSSNSTDTHWNSVSICVGVDLNAQNRNTSDIAGGNDATARQECAKLDQAGAFWAQTTCLGEHVAETQCAEGWWGDDYGRKCEGRTKKRQTDKKEEEPSILHTSVFRQWRWDMEIRIVAVTSQHSN